MTDPGFFGMPSAHRAELDDRFTNIETDLAAVESLPNRVEDLEAKTVVSVTDFGAVASTAASGAIDVTDEFQAAIDFVESAVKFTSGANLGGVVYVPAGAWFITTIQMKSRVALVGESRAATFIIHMDGIAHTGNMIELDDNLVNFTDLRHFALNGGSDASVNGINYQNASDTNEDNFLDIGDPFHSIGDIDLFGFNGTTGTTGTALTLNCRASLVHNVNIHQCSNGIVLSGSDNKVMNCDISWITEDAFVITGGNNKIVNVKCWFCGANPPGTSTGEAVYETADGFVIQSSRNTLIGCEAQDVSRHGLRIVNGDENQIQGLILDNIGNFFLMQGHGFEHPTSTAKSAIKIESAANGANYNRISATLAQRSANPDLQAIVNIGDSCINNYIDVMRSADNKSVGAPDIMVDEATATGNVILINGERQGLVVADIAAEEDDALELISTTVVDITSNDAGMHDNRIMAFRFLVPSLPQGATITSAHIQFKTAATTATEFSATITGEDADASVAFVASNTNISARAGTSASVAWADIPAWTSGGRTADQLTPNLATIVQEVVDRGGFDGVLTFFFIGDDTLPLTRNLALFDNDPATLTVVYEL